MGRAPFKREWMMTKKDRIAGLKGLLADIEAGTKNWMEIKPEWFGPQGDMAEFMTLRGKRKRADYVKAVLGKIDPPKAEKPKPVEKKIDVASPQVKMGRPSSYTPETGDEICERLANGESLRGICEDDHMPTKATVFRWIGSFPEFKNQYARAREAQADSIFDEILHIANTPVIGQKVKKIGTDVVEVTEGDMIEHRRLQIDARKWMAGKLRPKVYGDKLAISGDDDSPPVKLKIDTDIPAEAAAAYNRMMMKGK